jgi:hypothetical protein
MIRLGGTSGGDGIYESRLEEKDRWKRSESREESMTKRRDEAERREAM